MVSNSVLDGYFRFYYWQLSNKTNLTFAKKITVILEFYIYQKSVQTVTDNFLSKEKETESQFNALRMNILWLLQQLNLPRLNLSKLRNVHLRNR